ncbi:MAG: LLM class flavin-dependent oxidoreductase [Candidatus Limnocylindria bacterium]
MKFSVGLLGQVSGQYGARETADLARLAEDLDYAAYWVADNRWQRDVWTVLAACAERTRRIPLGPRVTDPYIRHPALTAIAIATLDELSGGRAILGLGAGGTGFGQLGIERTRPVQALREAVQLVRDFLSGGVVDFAGETVRFRRGQIGFPARGAPPILIAGRGPGILQLAGELADMAMVGAVVTARGVRWAQEQVEKGLSRAGRSWTDVELCSMTYVALSDDLPAARDAARMAVAQAVAGSYPSWDFIRASGLVVPDELHALIDAGVRDPARLAPLLTDQFTERLAVFGDAASCAASIRTMADAGIAHVVVAPIPIGEPAARSIERFASDVIPLVA